MRSLTIVFVIILFSCRSYCQSNNAIVDSLVKLAAISDSVGDLQTSIRYYSSILQIDSLRLVALVNRGRAFISLGQLDSGFVDYSRAIRHYPNEQVYCARGMAYCMTNNYSKAFNDFIVAKHLNPKSGGAYYGLSLIKIHDGQLKYASDFCRKADSIAYNPELSEAIRREIKKKTEEIKEK